MCVHNIKCVFKELNGVPYQMHVFREMKFVSHCYTVVLCQPILRHSVYKNSAVYLSGARVRFFFRDTRLGFPDYSFNKEIKTLWLMVADTSQEF